MNDYQLRHLPLLGGYVADCIEGKLGTELTEYWRWRPEKVEEYPRPVRQDLSELHGWCDPKSSDSVA
jgi:hypothetical protein